MTRPPTRLPQRVSIQSEYRTPNIGTTMPSRPEQLAYAGLETSEPSPYRCCPWPGNILDNHGLAE